MSYEQLVAQLIQDGVSVTQTVGLELGKSTWVIIAVVFGAALIAFAFWFFPVYGVWARRKNGQAELAEAEYAEQVAIQKASARLKSAEMHKKAELVEAEAAAQSIEIIGDALEKKEGYMRWQWIQMMEKHRGDTIYVPTEANLPILEATRKA